VLYLDVVTGTYGVEQFNAVSGGISSEYDYASAKERDIQAF